MRSVQYYPNVEVINLGFRRLTGMKKFPILDLERMQYVNTEAVKIMKIVGQKMFMATRKGTELLHRRLLLGPDSFFDICIAELISTGVANRSEFPVAGCRAHYSLVAAGKYLPEEMAEG